MISKRKPAAVTFAACAAIVLAGCGGKSEATTTSRQAPPMDVGVTTVMQKDVPIYGDWVATLDGYVNANIQPQVSGYLIKQDYREGSFVHKDDVLFEIDPRPFQAALDQAQAQLAQASGQRSQARGSSRRRMLSWASRRSTSSATRRSPRRTRFRKASWITTSGAGAGRGAGQDR